MCITRGRSNFTDQYRGNATRNEHHFVIFDVVRSDRSQVTGQKSDIKSGAYE